VVEFENLLDGGVPRAGETPEECVARFEAASEVVTTPCGDGDVIWRVWGEGEPLLLLHGNHGSWTHWLKNIPYFAERYRVFVPDEPGLGDSGVPPEPHSMDEMADIMNAGLDIVIPGERFHMAGFSYGSTMGGYMAVKLGDRLKSFGMIGSARLSGQRTMVEGLINWKRLETEEEIMDAHRHNLGRVMLSGPDAVDDLALYLQSVNTPRARVKSHKFMRKLTLPEALAELSIPITVFWGTADQYYPHFMKNYDEQIVERGIDIDVDVIEGAGHWAIYEAPEIMNEKLQALFEAND
tara:strand:- start:2 stop:886 length:885 start_codon:yes stop_codon:yes gene_type:complete